MTKMFSKTSSMSWSSINITFDPGLRRGIPNGLFDYKCSRMVNSNIEKLNNCEISHGICWSFPHFLLIKDVLEIIIEMTDFQLTFLLLNLACFLAYQMVLKRLIKAESTTTLHWGDHDKSQIFFSKTKLDLNFFPEIKIIPHSKV